MQSYAGKQIDQYRIIERLGMGGMAVVYKAYDTRLERDVALKLIRTSSIAPDHYNRLMKRFEREAKSQARFDHKHIVHIYDYGEVDDTPYLVMAFIQDGTLKERMQGPTDWRQAVRWLIPVAEALSYAHQRGVIHRDVKPANILFDEEDQPILTDFGIAKILETNEGTLTAAGLGVGTPEYMAPEQWQGKASGATDQYALGVVLYELITGKKPYSADTPAAVAIIQATEPLAPPSELVKTIPETVEKVLYKALARNPQDRYEGMDAFANALRGLLTKTGTEDLGLPKPAPQPQETAPVAKAAGSTSRRVNCDALDATPAERFPQTTINGKQEKKSLPKWILWAGSGVIGLIIIGLFFVMQTKFSKDSEGPLAMREMETASVTATHPPTLTQTALPTKTNTITQTPEPTLGVGSTMINDKDGAEMVYVPASEFLMGSEDGESNESPEHIVYLDAYWIYKYEVANADYRKCIEDGSCIGALSSYPENEYPAVDIDWYEATNYCNWAGGDLPTEAQWEKAARGSDGQTYPWGEASPNCNLAQFSYCSGETVLIGSFPGGVSPFGAFDMAGNVWEWVADWYSSDYYKTSPTQNPMGPANGNTRVIRGGSWDFDERNLRASYRNWFIPVSWHYIIGFRCASRVAP